MSIHVTVDVVLLTVREGRLEALLVQRANPPFEGAWALPGGFVEEHEDVEVAARRELEEETGIGLSGERRGGEAHDLAEPGHLEQLRTYGAPGRDPRGRTVTVAYLALVPNAPQPAAADDAADARFWPVADLIGGNGRLAETSLAFDHDRIVADGVERARAKLEYSTLATSFVDEPFTLADLRTVYEAVWGVRLHEANFRRKVLSTPGFIEATGQSVATAGRPARLYRRGAAERLHPALLRPSPQT